MPNSLEQIALKGLKQSLSEHRPDIAEHFLLALEKMAENQNCTTLRNTAYRQIISPTNN